MFRGDSSVLFLEPGNDSKRIYSMSFLFVCYWITFLKVSRILFNPYQWSVLSLDTEFKNHVTCSKLSTLKGLHHLLFWMVCPVTHTGIFISVSSWVKLLIKPYVPFIHIIKSHPPRYRFLFILHGAQWFLWSAFFGCLFFYFNSGNNFFLNLLICSNCFWHLPQK